MKRCNECGWSNNPIGEVNCKKCGAILDESSEERISFQGVESREQSTDSKKTVVGRKSDKKAVDENNPTLKKEDLQDGICQSCNYPLRAGSLVCPNCGANAIKKNALDTKKTLMFGDAGFNQINPETYYLSLSDQNGNKFEFELNDQVKKIGRNELDENNKSISSSHAQFSVVNGKLKLEDVSSNSMTFSQVKGNTELNDEDIIVLGNQIYKLNFRSK